MYLTACFICKVVTTTDNCCSKCLHSCSKGVRAPSATAVRHPGTARGTASQQGQTQGATPQGAPEDGSLPAQNVVLSPDGFQFEGYLKNTFSLSFPTEFA